MNPKLQNCTRALLMMLVIIRKSRAPLHILVLHTIRCTLYDAHYMLHTICCILYAAHYMLHTICCTLYAAHYTPHTVIC